MFLTDRKRQGVTVEPVTPSKQGIPMPKPPSSAPGHSGAAIGPRLRVDMGLANSQGLRPGMEDSYTMIKKFKIGQKDDFPAVFLALFDGHSSHRGSEHAAN